MNRYKKHRLLILLFFVLSGLSQSMFAQFATAPPQAELPQNPLPSDVYYDNHRPQLRSEWDQEPDPNGGSPEWGGNDPVGVALGDGLLAIALASASYIFFIAYPKRKQGKQSA